MPILSAYSWFLWLICSFGPFWCLKICYFSFDGSMDSNIAIRSMVHLNKKLHFYSGGGLTAGSNVKDEYQEIEDKAENIKQTLNFFKE